ncbi:MAG: methylmalonyl-CoA epimerase [Chloroflexi bacterium]|nr:methylmalonyl-CoA epimerase [Chloroflexota bacterium]
MFEQIDHIGVVVNSIDDALTTWRDTLGFALLERKAVPTHGVEVAFVDAGNGTVEFLAPTDSNSGTARFLASRGEGTHHICFAVADIVAALAELKSRGVRLIDETPRQGVHGLVAFVHPKAANGVLIELLQKSPHHP